MARAKLNKLALMLLAVTLGLAGCGYHFAATGNGLPANATTIYVANFGNHTRYNGLNDEFMRYLKEEISNRKRLVLSDDPSTADLTLSGNILMKNELPNAFNSVAEPTQYEETVSIDAKLRDNRSGKVIWATSGLTDVGRYPTVAQSVITTSPSFLQGNLRAQDVAQMPDLQVAASQQYLTESTMMERLARSLYSSMSQGF